MNELALYNDEESQESVIDLYVKGKKPTEIARETGLTRKDVQAVIRRFHEVAHADDQMRDLGRETLHKFIENYDRLISRLNDHVADIDSLTFTPAVAGKKTDAIKAIADLDAKKLDAIQKAGILENSDIAEQLAEMEEQKNVILDILRNDLCNKCRPKIMQKIGQMSGRVEVVVVQE